MLTIFVRGLRNVPTVGIKVLAIEYGGYYGEHPIVDTCYPAAAA